MSNNISLLFENFRLPGNQRKPGELCLAVLEDKIVDLSIYPPLGNIKKRIDCKGCYLSPGLLDLQLYGAGGKIFSEGLSEENFKIIDALHLRAGTTRYLMTIPSLKHEDILEAIAVTKEILSQKSTGCLGLHLEGPWLNPVQKGGHSSAIIRPPEIKKLKEIIQAGKGVIKLITIAPEQFLLEDLKWLLATGIPISAGHSNATEKESKAFFDLGVRLTTHLYNAMSGIHHRHPGLAGATLIDDRVFATIIADGIHVDYSMIGLAQRIKKERLLLISDATFFAMKEDLADYFGQTITNKENGYRNADGQLMGADIALLQAVKNMVRYVQTPIPEAIKMASTYPARFLGNLKHGQLAAGKIADILILDEQLNLQRVFRAGREVELR